MEEQIPEPSFTALLMMLAGSAVINLGETPNPSTNKVEKNLALAQHTIDILAMLKEKTKGNLTTEESGLLDEILYNLRMRYVEAKKKEG